MPVSCHMNNLIDPKEYQVTVKRVLDYLYTRRHDFDAIAFRGLSGSLIAPVVAYQLQKKMMAVRKERSPHTSYKIEAAHKATGRVLILDDFICSGTTIKEIISVVKSECPDTRIVGLYLWRASRRGTYEGIELWGFA